MALTLIGPGRPPTMTPPSLAADERQSGLDGILLHGCVHGAAPGAVCLWPCLRLVIVPGFDSQVCRPMSASLCSSPPHQSGTKQLVALFTFVARDALTNAAQRISPVVPETAQDRALFARRQQISDARRAARARSSAAATGLHSQGGERTARGDESWLGHAHP